MADDTFLERVWSLTEKCDRMACCAAFCTRSNFDKQIEDICTIIDVYHPGLCPQLRGSLRDYEIWKRYCVGVPFPVSHPYLKKEEKESCNLTISAERAVDNPATKTTSRVPTSRQPLKYQKVTIEDAEEDPVSNITGKGSSNTPISKVSMKGVPDEKSSKEESAESSQRYGPIGGINFAQVTDAAENRFRTRVDVSG
ncbi:hypothetical protein GLAREA_11416 [Glarea lozoyensis ATCC 20868]|uniref:Uncharacterized protein n=1 Tax=Glarea lozoyensis (strain ATCC 20868 / MF5171) TaxID=1116229 RepID=S3CG13_GLAL2|nr:uncharacterized protein GLAREA_11416 [Glarea lozoyensis ATCC 20868]EPE24835.1 hypothetical protein GLAREA_11416 [Glarea lozoyensis ATCC 20868]